MTTTNTTTATTQVPGNAVITVTNDASLLYGIVAILAIALVAAVIALAVRRRNGDVLMRTRTANPPRMADPQFAETPIQPVVPPVVPPAAPPAPPVVAVAPRSLPHTDRLLQKIAGTTAVPASDDEREAMAHAIATSSEIEANDLFRTNPAAFHGHLNKGHLSLEPQVRRLMQTEATTASRIKSELETELRHLQSVIVNLETQRSLLITERDNALTENTSLRATILQQSNEIAAHNTVLARHHAENFREVATSVRNQTQANDAVVAHRIRSEVPGAVMAAETVELRNDELFKMVVELTRLHDDQFVESADFIAAHKQDEAVLQGLANRSIKPPARRPQPQPPRSPRRNNRPQTPPTTPPAP